MEWIQKCDHSFTADVTDQMKEWSRLLGLAEERGDRSYYFDIYANGMVQLCDDTDGSSGIVLDLPDFKYCPMCGKAYPERENK